MPLYEFICKTPQGKEVKGECKARNAEDLASTLRGTGLVLQWWQEKRHDEHKIVTQAFAKEVAGILKTLGEPRNYRSHRTLQEKLQFMLIVAATIGGGIWLYTYMDARIDRLEKMLYRPHIVREISKHTIDLQAEKDQPEQ